MFAVGVVLSPAWWLKLHAEADLAAGLTTQNLSNSGILAYPTLGLTILQ